jgi:predicted nucleic acid-binding protein
MRELNELFITSVSLAELRFGIDRAPDPMKQVALSNWLENEIRPRFRGKVLEVTEETILLWRHLMEQGRKVGRTYSQPDLMIAAIAIENRMTLVIRNTRDFAGLTLPIFNPWEPQP